ncbi:hypothetical protein BV509_01040 [Rhodovulum sulfidophilum]|uniref:Secreted protein n=1 Tax=Rhodovulum visakhapatnamense TaxID=364297 RepID=A0ABS1RI70_9RHOB|nr:hypothetical protein [Rhodovulum visakhapatnamense]MBL3569921.1 hypothetical protein [Rhodovulum visakhapatnamense]MBL3578386.1 hypothetical protein [Rhodovulum visakhapatnamense]OLS43073.1 hypothetical protein BV509_01040 [Rhodovulum sulfidophilum]
MIRAAVFAMAVAAPASAATVPVWHADDLQVVTLANGRSAFRPVGSDAPFTAKWALPREAANCPQQALGKEWALCRMHAVPAVMFCATSCSRSLRPHSSPSSSAEWAVGSIGSFSSALNGWNNPAPVPQPTGPDVAQVPAPPAAVLIATAFLGLRAFRRATAPGRRRYARPIPFPFRRGAQVPPDRFQCAPRDYPPLSSSLAAVLPGEARTKTRGRDFRGAV